MIRKKQLFVLTALLWPSILWSQVTFEARIDTLLMFIGQQRELTFDVTCDEGQTVKMPDLRPGQPLTDVLEVVDCQGTDTTHLNEGKRMQVVQRWNITAFDSALVYLPPFEVEVNGKKYQSKSLAMKVLMMEVDTLHLDQFFPPKDIQDNPFSWDDWKPIFWYSVLAMLAGIMLAYVVVRWRQNKPIIRILRRTPKRPPHQVAMEEIERIKTDRRWADEDSKEYYTLLTDTLRKYIRERYGFNATEMTSTEIIDHLMREQNAQALDELRQLFTTADLVKFAKWTTLINENDANLVSAIDFINQTKVEVDPKAKPEPEVITVEEEGSRKRSLAMRIAMVVLAVGTILLLSYTIWLITDLIR